MRRRGSRSTRGSTFTYRFGAVNLNGVVKVDVHVDAHARNSRRSSVVDG
jgi:hypothetical protein